MKYSIAVMAHSSRSKYFEYLNVKLKPRSFLVDNGSFGLWENAKRAWLSFDPESDYHIVIQDDALICDYFHVWLEKALNLANGNPVSLYFQFKNKYKDAHFNRKIPKILSKNPEITMWKHKFLHWGLGIAIPTKLIPEMIEYCDRLDVFGDDMKIKEYLLSKGIEVNYVIPTLIDHRDDEKSLVGNGDNYKRKSPCFMG